MARRRKPTGRMRSALEFEGIKVDGNRWGSGCKAERLAGVVLTVRVTVWTVSSPLRTACAGAKTQLVCIGRPVQLKVSVPDIPPAGVTVRIVLPDCPWTMVSEEG